MIKGLRNSLVIVFTVAVIGSCGNNAEKEQKTALTDHMLDKNTCLVEEQGFPFSTNAQAQEKLRGVLSGISLATLQTLVEHDITVTLDNITPKETIKNSQIHAIFYQENKVISITDTAQIGAILDSFAEKIWGGIQTENGLLFAVTINGSKPVWQKTAPLHMQRAPTP